MRIRHGIDRLSIERFSKMIERQGIRALEKLFTDQECISLCNVPLSKLEIPLSDAQLRSWAARYCAKEAVSKALGQGIRGDVQFHGIEILKDSLGAPYVQLRHGTRELADALGVTDIALSITHEGGVAFASVVMLCTD